MEDSRPYDIVVYGASGFTGKFAAVEAVRTCKGKKIGIAGRSKSKLEETLARIESDLGIIHLYWTFYDCKKNDFLFQSHTPVAIIK